MYISIENEHPAHSLVNSDPIPPRTFLKVWDSFENEGWTRFSKFGVRLEKEGDERIHDRAWVMSTDPGPYVELVLTPAIKIQDIDSQIKEMRSLVLEKLRKLDIGLLGSGLVVGLGTSEEEYYRYRTPREAYDYFVNVRGWNHKTYVNLCSMQQVIDIPVEKAPLYSNLMHRLTGAMLFLFRNDPELTSNPDRLLTKRPKAWRDVPPTSGPFASDKARVYLPDQELATWKKYLEVLWESSPMYMVGTKSEGVSYIPSHPTFIEFLTQTPPEGWPVSTLAGATDKKVFPTMNHVALTEWTYYGFARLRMKWKEDVELSNLISAYKKGGDDLESFLKDSLKKVMLENRSPSAPQKGKEMCSLAFVAGLVANFEKTEDFVSKKSYDFWRKFALMAEKERINSKIDEVSVKELLVELLDLSREGLEARGYGEEVYLDPLYKQVYDETSPAEEMLKIFDEKGIEALPEYLLY